MTDDRLKELYNLAIERRAGSRRDSCVPPEAIADLVEQRGSEEARLATLDHVMSCAACRQDMELLRSFAEAQPTKTRWRPGRLPLAIAASAVLLVGAGVVWRSLGPTTPVLRGGAEGLLLVSPAGEVASPAPLIWRSVVGASRYQVEVLTADGASVVWQTATSDTVASPDPSAVRPGVDYGWWVRAVLSDGAEVSSPIQPFRIAVP